MISKVVEDDMKLFSGSVVLYWLCIFDLAVPLGAIGAQSVPPAQSAKPSTSSSWLSGNLDEKLTQLAKHHRGFDMAMVETGYRYSELYFAGKSSNWDYALYQLEKIKVAIENGYERRPARKTSSENLFLGKPYFDLSQAIKAKDQKRFNKAFSATTTACNHCHTVERVPFIKIDEPKTRPSVVVNWEGLPGS